MGCGCCCCCHKEAYAKEVYELVDAEFHRGCEPERLGCEGAVGSSDIAYVPDIGSYEPPLAPKPSLPEVPLLDNLVRLGHIGHGFTSLVELYEDQTTGKTYAMKVVSKGHVVKLKKHASMMREKSILGMVDSPFIVKLLTTYDSPQHLYFLMEALLGGQLRQTYYDQKMYGSAAHTRYYAAGAVLALEHLHHHNIVYRDLKPENMVLDAHGGVKLTDMGAAKVVTDKTFTREGTPDYLAPEVIARVGHGRAVDWWTLGILLFELMSGSPPFTAEKPALIYEKVAAGIESVLFPFACQGDVGELINGLLQRSPDDRLPSRPGGLQMLKAHAWYSDFDWSAMAATQLQPPYVPIVRSNRDLTNFQEVPRPTTSKFTPYEDDGSAWDSGFASRV